jgi:hypothetical protein
MTLPVIYNADDFSWGAAGSFRTAAFETFYYGGHSDNSIGQSGRGTPQGYSIIGSPNNGWLGWALINLATGAALTPSRVGQFFGHNMRGIANGAPNLIFCKWLEAQGGPTHVQLITDAANHIVAMNGSGAIIGTSTFVYPGSASDGSGPTPVIEAICTVHSSTGSVQVKVDDVLVLDLSNVNTRNGGTGVVGAVEIHNEATRISSEWVIHDGSAWLGADKRVGCFNAATAGTYTTGTPTGAATAVACVDDGFREAESDTVLAIDGTSLPKKATFGVDALPANATGVVCVIPQVVVKKSDAGTNTGKVALKSGATLTLDASARLIPDAFTSLRQGPHHTNPNTTAAWTILEVNAAQPGFERDS